MEAEQKKREYEREREASERENRREIDLKRLEAEEKKRVDEREEREKERLFEREKIRIQQHIQTERLRLIDEGKMRSGEDSPVSSDTHGVLSRMIRFLPKFNERDPDIFFSLFEGIADEHSWNDTQRTLSLQTVFTGRAQDAFAACHLQSANSIVASKRRFCEHMNKCQSITRVSAGS